MPLKYVDVELQYKIHKNLKKADIVALQEWHRKQPHLPSVTELELVIILHCCYFSIERAKLTLENYFTMRTGAPELFGKADTPEFHNTLDAIVFVPLQNLTEDDYQIFFCKFLNYVPAAFILGSTVKYLETVIKMRLLEKGPIEGIVVVADLKGLSLNHFTKLSLMEVRKLIAFFQEALFSRMKSIHCINSPPFVSTILAMLKPYTKSELLSLLHFHSDKLEALFKYVPQDLLPMDYGGIIDSIANLHDAIKKKVIANADFIESEECRVVDESKRQGGPLNVDTLFGIEGSFKKLEID